MRPTTPKNLTGEARTEWKRICNELEQLGNLDKTDRAVLTLYVKAWQRWSDAQAKVEECGIMLEAPKTKVKMANPYLSICNKAHEQLTDILDSLGLTPLARARLAKVKTPAREPETAELVF